MTHTPRTLSVDPDATVWSVPASGRTQALAERPLLVLLHGFGANEHDLAGLFDVIGHDYVMASPRAPLPIEGMPGARAWFPLDPTQLANPDTALADAAVRGVLEWLEGVQAQVRIPGPVGLLGFSQGGAMCLQMLRHRPEAFACAVLLSSFMVPGLHSGDAALAQIRPPVFTGHDPADPLVPASATERLAAFLKEHATLTSRIYPGIAHSISAPEMDDVVTFLGEHLSPS